MNTNAPKTHKVRKGVAAVVMNVILIIFSLSCIFPIVWMAYSSLKEKRVFNADIMGLPMGIFLVEGYVKTIPVSLEEAAAIDGSNFTHTLWTISFQSAARSLQQ